MKGSISATCRVCNTCNVIGIYSKIVEKLVSIYDEKSKDILKARQLQLICFTSLTLRETKFYFEEDINSLFLD